MACFLSTLSPDFEDEARPLWGQVKVLDWIK